MVAIQVHLCISGSLSAQRKNRNKAGRAIGKCERMMTPELLIFPISAEVNACLSHYAFRAHSFSCTSVNKNSHCFFFRSLKARVLSSWEQNTSLKKLCLNHKTILSFPMYPFINMGAERKRRKLGEKKLFTVYNKTLQSLNEISSSFRFSLTWTLSKSPSLHL